MIGIVALYAKIEELLSILDNQDTAYDYEKAFDEKWREISKEVFQQSFGQLQANRNKKNDKKQVWRGASQQSPSLFNRWQTCGWLTRVQNGNK